MNKLERAVENLIKAVGKIHPAIQDIKQCHPKPPRKPRTKKEIVQTEVKEAEVRAEEPTVVKSKRGKFAKGSQDAKDFMNMLRERRKNKKL